jgi:hypothetical protein
VIRGVVPCNQMGHLVEDQLSQVDAMVEVVVPLHPSAVHIQHLGSEGTPVRTICGWFPCRYATPWPLEGIGSAGQRAG